jgi:hypothetical protein
MNAQEIPKAIIDFYQSFERGAAAQRLVTEERRKRNMLENRLKGEFEETAAICVEEGDLRLRATMRRNVLNVGIPQIRSDLLKAGFTDEQIALIDRIRNQKRTEMRLEVNVAPPKRKRESEEGDGDWAERFGDL